MTQQTQQPPDPNVPKNCMDCPSLLLSGMSSQANFIHKDVGAPVCSRYGVVIGNLNSKPSERKKIGATYAKDCPSFGKAAPLAPEWSSLKLEVALPDPQAIIPDDQRNKPELVNSCRLCSNYIREDAAASELGYTSGVCAAKGKLLLPSRLTFEAKNCGYRTYGMVRTNASGLTMLPEYTTAQRGSVDPVRNHQLQKAKAFVDPNAYPTDKPVSQEDQGAGIRAWRSIFDPLTENEVFLPIFRVEFFSPEEQAKIPQTGDDEHPEDYIDHNFYTYKVAVLWQELDETPGVWGQPGTGKTELFRHMAWLMQLPFYRFSITARSELEDLAGSKEYSPDKGTFFRPGRFVKAWQKPCVVVVDEPNAGPDEVWHFFRPLTDNSKQLVLDMAGEDHPRQRHDFCYLGMAMNPPWDARNSGIKPIADADARRLHHMFVDLPPEEIERDIIKTRVTHDGWEISNEKLYKIMGISKDVRNLVKEDTLPISWGIAMNIKVARALRWFDFQSAYRMAAGDFLEPEAMEMLIEVVRTHVD